MQTPAIPYAKSWLLFFLVATVGGGLLGMVIGAVLGAFLGVAGVSLESVKLICGAVGFVVALPISFFTFQWSVRTYIVDPLLRQTGQQRPA
ncbi:hypothetical protein [Frateuria sp. YIM B11624]|uniref:hypothetical protein n=1 Tax=Frateuria sp. YIM B11624 TaxID=3143185 RepID=UPI003C7903B1